MLAVSIKVKITYRNAKSGEEVAQFHGDEMGEGACHEAIQFLEDLTVNGHVQLIDVITIDSGEDFDDEHEEQ
jgi:hypothetical protein